MYSIPSADITAEAQAFAKQTPSPSVLVTFYGWRIQLLSMYPNIIRMRAVAPDAAQHHQGRLTLPRLRGEWLARLLGLGSLGLQARRNWFEAAGQHGRRPRLGVRVPVIHYSDHEDYSAGEIARALPGWRWRPCAVSSAPIAYCRSISRNIRR